MILRTWGAACCAPTFCDDIALHTRPRLPSQNRRQGCPSFLRASRRYGALLVAEGGHGVGGGGAAGGGQAGGDGGADEQHGDDGEDDGVAGGFVDPAGGEFAEGEAED